MNNRHIDFLLVLTACLLLLFYVPMELSGHHNHEQEFLSFVEQFNKSYSKEHPDYEVKLANFKDTLQRIAELNDAGENDAEYGLTKFADMSPSEFRQQQLSGRLSNGPRLLKSPLKLAAPGTMTRRSAKFQLPAGLPKKVDWREKGYVTPVQDQGDCGACWAFSTVEVLETMYAIKTGNLTQLSIQQVLDCSTQNLGCDGGDVCWALEWMQKNRIVPEKKYPLKLVDETCMLQRSRDGVRLSTFWCGSLVNNEQALLKVLATIGPVAVGADATSWQDYVGGVIRFNCENDLNHAVQIVGYDFTGSVPFYIVRNSWGEDYGLDGYLYVAIGSNLCGFAEEVGYLTV